MHGAKWSSNWETVKIYIYIYIYIYAVKYLVQNGQAQAWIYFYFERFIVLILNKTKFSYKISCSPKLQTYSIFIY